jgi:hypothetical protein
MRDGLRIYLWEKYKEGDQESFSHTGKVALLVHGGTWSGRPLFDLRIRDYSLMDFLAENGYDVWPLTSTATGVPTRLTKIGRIRIPQPPISLQR